MYIHIYIYIYIYICTYVVCLYVYRNHRKLALGKTLDLHGEEVWWEESLSVFREIRKVDVEEKRALQNFATKYRPDSSIVPDRPQWTVKCGSGDDLQQLKTKITTLYHQTK